MNPTNSESIIGQTEEEKPGTEVTQGSEQQPGDGKSKPASEKIWGSFLKNSGLGKVMGGKKKKETGSAEANVEVQGQDKSPTHCPASHEEGSSPPSVLEGQSANLESPESQKQSTEKEAEKGDDEVSQEQRPSSSNKDVKPKQGEKSSVRDLIRKPVTRIFSHKSTEKKEYGADARKHKKTRSRSLDRLEDAEALAAAADPTDDVQAAGEAHQSIPHEAKHMKRWHSFKKMMSQKSVKKNTEDSKDMEGAEASVDTQADIGTLESATKLDHAGQKKWKLKRSWTFQGLKRDPSVLGIHKSKGSDKGEQITGDTDQGTAGSSEDCKLSEEGETQEREHSEQDDEKGSSTQRAKSTDHHTNEMWTSFKKRVTPKSKKPVEHVTATEEEQTGEGEHAEEQVCREEGKSAKQSQKKTHFNRAVSLKNFLLRKGKGTSMDMGETVPEQKDGGAEGASGDTDDKDGNADEGSANQTSLGDLPPEKDGNSQAEDKKGSDEEERDLSERMSPSHEVKSPEITETGNASEATSSNEAITETKICQENGSSRTEDDCSGSGAECAEHHTEVKEKKTEDTTANETALQEDGLKEVKKEDSCSQEAVKQNEKTCSNILKDDENLGPEDYSGSPVDKSGECAADRDFYHLHQPGTYTEQHKLELHASSELEPCEQGPPQNGGSHAGSGETHTEINNQEEDQKRIFFEAAASIVKMVVSAAADQIAEDMDLLDNGFKGSQESYVDHDINNYL
ncbi:A-kinase anchor protein 12-like [Scleropages formosus]|uniref:A-kinase anchor protein 12-like n=1 Tax=Scleropages formosus TaxID=113540 RepID=A0A0P7UFQ3_SCLFO|nr:A-kinase anchor protein 12-like [Scleropages formosus]